MKSLLIILFVFTILDRSDGCNPATWTPREREIYECLRRKGWSNGRQLDLYNGVLKPGTAGRASCYVQELVRGCIGPEDFRHYGVTIDDCSPATAAPPVTPKVVYVYVYGPPPVASSPTGGAVSAVSVSVVAAAQVATIQT